MSAEASAVSTAPVHGPSNPPRRSVIEMGVLAQGPAVIESRAVGDVVVVVVFHFMGRASRLPSGATPSRNPPKTPTTDPQAETRSPGPK